MAPGSPPEPVPAPLTIVLDTNIWLAEHMLRHSAGSAFRFFLATKKARLAVPEVVRMELEHNLADRLTTAASRIRDNHSYLLRVIGELKELVLPSGGELQKAAKNAIAATRIEVLDIPFTLESARASLNKCIQGVPPNGPKDQQFKDGVIWADCLQLAEEGPVHLVSGDKAFFKGRDYAGGLAPNLREEAETARFTITLSHELQAVLEKVKTEVPINYGSISEAFLPNFGGTEIPMLEREGFSLGLLAGGKHELFATDNPEEAHLEFTLIYDCPHADGRVGQLMASGEASCSPKGELTSPIQSKGSEFVFPGEDGETIRRNVIIGVMAAHLGHRTVHLEVRAPIQKQSVGGGME